MASQRAGYPVPAAGHHDAPASFWGRFPEAPQCRPRIGFRPGGGRWRLEALLTTRLPIPPSPKCTRKMAISRWNKAGIGLSAMGLLRWQRQSCDLADLSGFIGAGDFQRGE